MALRKNCYPTSLFTVYHGWQRPLKRYILLKHSLWPLSVFQILQVDAHMSDISSRCSLFFFLNRTEIRFSQGSLLNLFFFESKRILCIIHLEMKRNHVNVDLNRKMSSSQTRQNISEKSIQNKLIQFLNSSENSSTTYTPCRYYLVHLYESLILFLGKQKWLPQWLSEWHRDSHSKRHSLGHTVFSLKQFVLI